MKSGLDAMPLFLLDDLLKGEIIWSPLGKINDILANVMKCSKQVKWTLYFFVFGQIGLF